ncbi:MAG: LysM domain-containing protein [Desulfobacterales bacterium]
MFLEQRKTARVLLVLSFIWILNCCAYQHPPLQPAPEVPPAPVEIKPETPVAVPDTPALEIPTPAEPEPRFYLHKVRWPEETLSHIAKWYTGTVKNWKAIAKANPELDPKKIDTGDTISIPEDLLTSRKPMPLSFMRASVRKKSIPSSSSNKTSIKSESPKLFRPIESEPSIIETDAAKLFGPIETQQSSIEPDAAKLFGPIE